MPHSPSFLFHSVLEPNKVNSMAKWSLRPSWFNAMRQFTLSNRTRQRWFYKLPKVYGSPLHVSTISFARFPHGRRVNEGRETLIGDDIILALKHTCMAIGRSPDTHDNPFVSFLLHVPATRNMSSLPWVWATLAKSVAKVKRMWGLTCAYDIGALSQGWFIYPGLVSSSNLDLNSNSNL